MPEQPKVKKQESELTPEQLDSVAGGRGTYASGGDSDVHSEGNTSGMAIEKIEICVEKVERA